MGRPHVQAKISELIVLIDSSPKPQPVSPADPGVGLRTAFVAAEVASLAEYVRGYAAALKAATGA